jgi:hypothetical protein
MNEMASNNTSTPTSNRQPQAAPRPAACRREWLLDAVRYVFRAEMTDRRG